MAVHDFPGGTAEHGDSESEFTDRCLHAVYGSIVLSGVPRVFFKPTDWLVDDLHTGHSRHGRRDSGDEADLRIGHPLVISSSIFFTVACNVIKVSRAPEVASMSL